MMDRQDQGVTALSAVFWTGHLAGMMLALGVAQLATAGSARGELDVAATSR
jgi:hypothetical protein